MNRLGAPPRRNLTTTNESLVLAEAAATAALEEASQNLVPQSEWKPRPPRAVCVRRPRLPRAALRRKRPWPCELAVKAQPGATTKAERLAAAEKVMEVIEARYVRDLFGKQDNILLRSDLDKEVLNLDEEIIGMADYRQAAACHYQQHHRAKANSWGKMTERQRGLYEIRWKLKHGYLEISTPSDGDDLPRPCCDIQEDDALLPPVPRNSPCESKGKGMFSVIPALRRASMSKQAGRRRSSITMNDFAAEGQDANILKGYEDIDESTKDKDDDVEQKEHQKAMSVLKHRHTLQERMHRLRHVRRSSQKAAKQSKTMPVGEAASGAASRREVTFGYGLHNDRASSQGSSFGSADEEDEERSDMADLAQLPGRKSSQQIQEMGLAQLKGELGFSRGSSTVEHRASQVALFKSWNAKDQDDLRQVFDRHDTNKNDTLDQSELAICLKGLGLRGKSELERDEIRQILWAIDKLEVGFLEFATKIVPSIRSRLGLLRSEKLAEAFRDADVDGSGRLSIQETLREVRLMGTFPNDEQVREAIAQVAPTASQNAKSLDGSWLMSRDILDFTGFAQLVDILKEKTECERVTQFRKLVEELSLDEEDREIFQHNLVDMNTAFSRLGRSSKGHLNSVQVVSKTNAQVIIRECGLAPRNMTQRGLVSTTVNEEADSEGNVDIRALLDVVKKLREHDRQWLHRIFDKYDANRSGGLALSEVQCALNECGVNPRTANDVAEVKMLIDEFDEDGSGEVNQKEFVELCRFVSERIHKVQREEERQTAVRFGWTDKHFDELRSAFMLLDGDASDTLEFDEMVQAVESLQRTCSRADLNHVMQDAGVSFEQKGSNVDFLGFMRIVKALEDRESQRLVAKKYDFEAESLNRLRTAFRNLLPNEEGVVQRDKLEPLLTDGDDDSSFSAELQHELTSTQPPKVGFEVFVKFMKKKLNAATKRRT